MSERFTPSEVITVSVDTATELEEHIKASEEVRRKLASCGVNEIQAEAGMAGRYRVVRLIGTTHEQKQISLMTIMEGEIMTVNTALENLSTLLEESRQQIQSLRTTKPQTPLEETPCVSLLELILVEPLVASADPLIKHSPLIRLYRTDDAFYPHDKGQPYSQLYDRLAHNLWQNGFGVVNIPVWTDCIKIDNPARHPEWLQPDGTFRSKSLEDAQRKLCALTHKNRVIAFHTDQEGPTWILTVAYIERNPTNTWTGKELNSRLQNLRQTSLHHLLLKQPEIRGNANVSFGINTSEKMKNYQGAFKIPCFDGGDIVPEDDPEIVHTIREVIEASNSFTKVEIQIFGSGSGQLYMQLNVHEDEWQETAVEPERQNVFQGTDTVKLNDDLAGSLDIIDEAAIKQSCLFNDDEKFEATEILTMALDEKISDLEVSQRLDLKIGTEAPNEALYGKKRIGDFHINVAVEELHTPGSHLIPDADFQNLLKKVDKSRRRDSKLYLHCFFRYEGKAPVLTVHIYSNRD